MIELQVGPVSAILGFYLLAQCLRGDRRPDALALFAVGALVPDPDPADLQPARLRLALGHGLFSSRDASRSPMSITPTIPSACASPINSGTSSSPSSGGVIAGSRFTPRSCWLTIPGWVVLIVRRHWDLAVVTFSVVVAVTLVNLFYPEWTGGWSTGPRLLVPSIPFAMLPVAALLAGDSRATTGATIIAVVLGLAGAALMLLFQSVGGRIPLNYSDPLVQTVWPIWTGQVPLPGGGLDERFTRNLVSLMAPDRVARLAPGWSCVQFMPLVLVQGIAILTLFRHGETHVAVDQKDR